MTVSLSLSLLTVSVSCLYRKRWLHRTHQFCRQYDKSSAVAEMGDRLATLGMGRKWERGWVAI